MNWDEMENEEKLNLIMRQVYLKMEGF